MSRSLKHTLSFAIMTLMVLLAPSCRDDILLDDSQLVCGEGDMTLNLSLDFPKPSQIATRSFGMNPDPELDLYMFIFESGALVQRVYIPYEAQNFTANPTGEIDNHLTSHFAVKLNSTEGNVVIHVIAVNDPEETFKKDIESLEFWGSETNVIYNSNFPSTANGQDAYWQRVELGCALTIEDQSRIQGKLTNVPMIRNFGMVSVSSTLFESGGGTHFEYQGFQIINARDRGTVAPAFLKDGETEFAKFDRESLEQSEYAGFQTYYEQIINQGYFGRTAPKAVRIPELRSENLPNIKDWDIDQTPKYFYEYNYAATNRIYVIVKGLFGNDTQPSYYKLDIGETDPANNLYSPYYLLRNIDYHITIGAVWGRGYPTPKAAAEGVAFNNISASVETRDMVNLSDGHNMIMVNFTTNVIVNTDEPYIDFRYKYYTDMDKSAAGTLANGRVVADDPNYGPKPGPVISRVEHTAGTLEDGWKQIKIYYNEPNEILKQQQFTIYDPNGLSRTITLILVTPWKFRHLDTYPGEWEEFGQWKDDDIPWDWSDEQRFIGPFLGAELTVFFELPPGLPEAMFPLQFVIESDKQNIQNAYVGNAVVQSAPSLFPELTSESRIQYVKTVQYNDYDTENPEYPNASRIVRCRFLTITDLRDENIGGGVPDDSDNENDSYSLSTIRIYNPYFLLGEDGFQRDTRYKNPEKGESTDD